MQLRIDEDTNEEDSNRWLKGLDITLDNQNLLLLQNSLQLLL
jgi:hypothetical protein